MGSGTSEAFLHVLADPNGDRPIWGQEDDFWILWAGTKMQLLHYQYPVRNLNISNDPVLAFNQCVHLLLYPSISTPQQLVGNQISKGKTRWVPGEERVR